MTEIIAAIVGGVFALGAAVITVRWTRSRSAGDPATPRPDSTSNTGPGSPTPTTPQANEIIHRDAPINAGQYIQTNNGTVSQTNYRDGKQ
ncbi:hypothetical protein ACFV80_08245 [Streptomyces sp. NPDC059862]|uniref:hypothetical protein n=1 Tax=Streptomyces sp. NPDC059862 TaxID=3346975 RepID=UPI003646F863